MFAGVGRTWATVLLQQGLACFLSSAPLFETHACAGRRFPLIVRYAVSGAHNAPTPLFSARNGKKQLRMHFVEVWWFDTVWAADTKFTKHNAAGTVEKLHILETTAVDCNEITACSADMKRSEKSTTFRLLHSMCSYTDRIKMGECMQTNKQMNT